MAATGKIGEKVQALQKRLKQKGSRALARPAVKSDKLKSASRESAIARRRRQ